jgi:hypothetical protein
MRTTKLGAVLASLALTTGTAAVLAAGPATAQSDTPTQVALTLGGNAGVTARYGTFIGTFSTQVTTDGITPVTAGTTKLQRKLPGKDWRNVKTDDDASDGVSFGTYGDTARGNVKYRAHYLGGTDNGTATTYAASYSNTVIVRTAWNLNDHGVCSPKCRIYGKLAPKSKHHKILIQAKHGSWKRYKVVHTNARSHWSASVKPTRGNGTKYRAVVAGTKHLIKSYSTIYRVYIIASKSAYSVSPR